MFIVSPNGGNDNNCNYEVKVILTLIPQRGE
jgi:hypothetical protein